MPDPTQAGGERWFERGDRVRFGNAVGVVQASFDNGLHYVYVESERRIVTLPGHMLTLVPAPPEKRPAQ